MTSLAEVVPVYFFTVISCLLSAAVLTKILRASQLTPTPPSGERRPAFRWRYLAIGLVWPGAFAWPPAALLIHIPLFVQLVVSGWVATVSPAIPLVDAIRQAGRANHAE
jgi:hypothetical protein